MSMNETTVATEAAGTASPASAASENTSREKIVAEIIVVTSGKGGVGKTTTSASLACGLRHRSKVVDDDLADLAGPHDAGLGHGHEIDIVRR